MTTDWKKLHPLTAANILTMRQNLRKLMLLSTLIVVPNPTVLSVDTVSDEETIRRVQSELEAHDAEFWKGLSEGPFSDPEALATHGPPPVVSFRFTVADPTDDDRAVLIIPEGVVVRRLTHTLSITFNRPLDKDAKK